MNFLKDERVEKIFVEEDVPDPKFTDLNEEIEDRNKKNISSEL